MVSANNSIKEQIEQIQQYCERLAPDYEDNASWFNPLATEEQIADWEHLHSTTIPESYKDWLRFANGCQIVSQTANFLGLDRIRDDLPYLDRDWVLIGNLIGDGEVVCFSKSKGNFLSYFETIATEYDSLNEILNLIIDLLRSDCGEETMSKEDLDLFMFYVKKSEETRARRKKKQRSQKLTIIIEIKLLNL